MLIAKIAKRLLVIILLLAFFISPSITFAKSSEEILTSAKPSVVRIGVMLFGTVRTPEPLLNMDTLTLEPGDQVGEAKVSTALLGSGFVVHPSGYIVTNAHVVDISTDTVADYIWAKYSDQLYQRLDQTLPPELSQESLNALHDALLNFVSQYGEIENLEYQISVFNPEQKEGTIQDFIDKGFQVDLKKVGQPYPQAGKDVAIIKIEKENLKALPLGDSKLVKGGNKVYVLGYPVIADLNEAGFTEPTFTSGIVSAIKKSAEGDYNVIQIDAAISGGNSGGPAFNEKGEVIGIATFGAFEQGFNWILPIDLAKEYLQELNVKYNTGGNNILENILKPVLIAVPVAFILIGIGVFLFIKKRKSVSSQVIPIVSQPIQPNSQLAQYVSGARAKGMSNDQIRMELVKTGYNEATIDQALGA